MRVFSYHAETLTGTAYTEVDDEHLVNVEILPLSVKKGSAIIFNDRILHMSTPNRSKGVRWSVDLRYQPTDQDPMPGHGAGFLARSRDHPDQVATLEDWLVGRLGRHDHWGHCLPITDESKLWSYWFQPGRNPCRRSIPPICSC